MAACALATLTRLAAAAGAAAPILPHPPLTAAPARPQHDRAHHRPVALHPPLRRQARLRGRDSRRRDDGSAPRAGGLQPGGGGGGSVTTSLGHLSPFPTQRMRRDWIQTGRRPAGICGACLLIAARVHGFRRSTAEVQVIPGREPWMYLTLGIAFCADPPGNPPPASVQHVVKVSDMTLRNRLAEFENAPSSGLAPEDLLVRL